MKDVLANERLLRRIEWTSYVLSAVFCAAAWWIFTFKMAVGVFLGGLIASLSFQTLKWQLRRAFLRPGSAPSKGGLFASYYLRYLGTLFLVFVVLHYGWANPIAFLVGLSVMVLSIVVVGGFEFFVMLAKKGEG